MPHLHKKIDFTVEVFIVHKNKVLLRRHDKYKIWLGVGGHIDLDEDPNQAAIREVKEEVGINIKLANKPAPNKYITKDYKELIAPEFLNRHRINKTHEHVTLVYFATAKSNKVVTNSRDKSTEWKWFTVNELNRNTYGIKRDIIFYAKQALMKMVKIDKFNYLG